jgi:hypothetical protein
MVSVRRARRRQDHCASCRYQTIETIALLTPLSRPNRMPAAPELTSREPWRRETIAFRARGGAATAPRGAFTDSHGCATEGRDELRRGAISEPDRRSSVGHGDPNPAEGLRQARTNGTPPPSKSSASAHTPQVARLRLRPLRRRSQSGCRTTDRSRRKPTPPAMAALEVRDSRTPDTGSVVVTSSSHHGLRSHLGIRSANSTRAVSTATAPTTARNR